LEFAFMKRAIFTTLAMLFIIPGLRAEDWPGWRGPRLDGTSLEKNLPVTWSAKDNIAWKTDIHGIGHSSPVVVGDRVFLTTCLLKEGQRMLLCLDRRDGKILWEKLVLTSPLEKKHKLNSFASSTVACDGQLVFTTFLQLRPRTDKDTALPRKPRDVGYLDKKKDEISEMIVACYTVDGDLVWHKSPGQFYSRHGFCSAPILYKDKVIVNGDQDAEAYIVALDKKTGAECWRIDRPNRTRSYCVPLIVEAAGKMQMVLAGSMCTTSYSPETGKLIWNMKGPTEQFVASPVYGDGLIFMTAGFPTYHNWTIRPDGEGDITASHIAWHESKTVARKASYVPSPLAVPGYFYMISDLGPLSCFEAKTGKRLWIEELGKHHSASPVLADGRVYLTDDDGITYVLKADGTSEILARNALNDECYSSPAISHGQIFIRTLSGLWCIGRK
jgi:outer membrane protein assembly factor BamB